MNARTPPPRGLRWAATSWARAFSFVLAVAALMVSVYVGRQYADLIECLQARDAADQQRTAAIAAATDAERAADLALIRGGPDPRALRAAAIAAREHTDRVRRDHPAPHPKPCG